MALVSSSCGSPGIYNRLVLVSKLSGLTWGHEIYFLSRFGWTGFTPAIPWIAPATAGLFIGFGVLCIFLPCFNYIVDAYLPL